MSGRGGGSLRHRIAHRAHARTVSTPVVVLVAIIVLGAVLLGVVEVLARAYELETEQADFDD